MRTTLNIDDDILQAAREIAERKGATAGEIISTLARRGLAAPKSGGPSGVRNGVPLLPSRGEVVTLDRIEKLMDDEGV